mmetsp:Transcript_13590/g.18599  ORF Transcript_13590/g.18599 Transcript_13590/m.18599 type:complete len:186 (-) Transcript_13590:705-1262(-)|eukprot:CAMPEP_0185586030 /NCGR_PEP_ID=MMETSP0434-20130131/42168_1 /TAXON_ID=626734 ORGANISM="Favella taraikaensis, Strain Fe Narragansett Bay" /NCGR_SAMPLE_ID=MMETSP0434 /ASSEMBLY_ACC=CAM_ASM_000379 /LENGTH=185 /DNA_ID=CAMNT_0028206815 /DNA_START=699 /DNA_END=1256 /DNA_ORIENTATION=+
MNTSVVTSNNSDNQEMPMAPISGASISHLSIPVSYGGKRRVHAEGLKMLDQHYQRIEEEMKMQTMENRIRRLEFEEKRAQKMEETANKRADSMIDARKRHFEDLLVKKNHYYNVAIQEEKQRMQNQRNRLERKSAIKLGRIEAMAANQMAKEETVHTVTEARIKQQKIAQSEIEKQKEVKLKELI